MRYLKQEVSVQFVSDRCNPSVDAVQNFQRHLLPITLHLQLALVTLLDGEPKRRQVLYRAWRLRYLLYIDRDPKSVPEAERPTTRVSTCRELSSRPSKTPYWDAHATLRAPKRYILHLLRSGPIRSWHKPVRQGQNQCLTSCR